MKLYPHDELAIKAGSWLHARLTQSGARDAFEVRLADQYVADYVALGWLSGELMKVYGAIAGKYVHSEQAERKGRWVLPEQFPESRSLMFVMEAKASRADFLSTFNGTERHENRKMPIGSFHWVVANRGVCSAEELPDFWGLLFPSGRGLTEVKRPEYNQITEEYMASVAYQMLWKTDAGHYSAILTKMASLDYDLSSLSGYTEAWTERKKERR